MAAQESHHSLIKTSNKTLTIHSLGFQQSLIKKTIPISERVSSQVNFIHQPTTNPSKMN